MLIRTPQHTGQPPQQWILLPRVPAVQTLRSPAAGGDGEETQALGRQLGGRGRKWAWERDLFLVLSSWTNYMNFLRLSLLI